MKQFVSFCEERGGLHKAAIVKSTLVAVTSVQGAERVLEQVYSKLQRNKDIRNIIIHCGVDTCANCFRLEERAYNGKSSC